MPLAKAGAPDGMAWRASMLGTAGSSLIEAPTGRRCRWEKPEMPWRVDSEDDDEEDGAGDEGTRWRVSEPPSMVRVELPDLLPKADSMRAGKTLRLEGPWDLLWGSLE